MTVSEEAKAWAGGSKAVADRLDIAEAAVILAISKHSSSDRLAMNALTSRLKKAHCSAYDAGVAAERERHAKLVAAAREFLDATATRDVAGYRPYAEEVAARHRFNAALAALRALLEGEA